MASNKRGEYRRQSLGVALVYIVWLILLLVSHWLRSVWP